MEQIRNTLTHDEHCLDCMRKIVKEYIAYRQKHPTETKAITLYQMQYEEQRQKMHDHDLKAFTAFELMEKLYWQEYLIHG